MSIGDSTIEPNGESLSSSSPNQIFELISKLNDTSLETGGSSKSNSPRQSKPDLISTSPPIMNNKNFSNNDIQSLNLTEDGGGGRRGSNNSESLVIASSSCDVITKPLQQPVVPKPTAGISSRIPRIPYLHNKSSQPASETGGVKENFVSSSLSSNMDNSQIQVIRSQLMNGSVGGEKSMPQNTKVINNSSSRPSKIRAPRSLSKSTSANTKNSQTSGTQVGIGANKVPTSRAPTETSRNVPRRGVSLVMNRELSFTNSNNNSIENLTESVCSGQSRQSNSGSGPKTVKYIIRHKPKESKVKIFSQKLDMSKVSAKIGSFEKASHRPAGGQVKIESHKLTWNAQAKIGSLDYANHKPAGGNVKIQNFKVDFSKRARPRTDTGLIVVEMDDDVNGHLNRSQASSQDLLNRSEYSLNGSN